MTTPEPKNVTTRGETLELRPRPLPTTKRYQFGFYARALRNLLSWHRPRWGQVFPWVRMPLHSSPEHHARWHEFFQVPAEAPPPPFTYNSVAGAPLLYRLVKLAGINMKNLLHLQSETRFLHHNGLLDAERPYWVEMTIGGVLPLEHGRVAVRFDNRTVDDQGRAWARGYDYMFVRRCPSLAQNSPLLIENLVDADKFKGLSRQEPSWPRWRSSEGGQGRFFIPPRAGRRYGRLSGDFNVVHISPLAARLFGFPGPFVQGYCTLNHVIRVLSEHHPQGLRGVNIIFNRPAFENQTATVRHDQSRFEVCDQEGRLVAHGQFRTSRPQFGHSRAG